MKQKKTNTLAKCQIRLVIPAKAGIQRKNSTRRTRFPAFLHMAKVLPK